MSYFSNLIKNYHLSYLWFSENILSHKNIILHDVFHSHSSTNYPKHSHRETTPEAETLDVCLYENHGSVLHHFHSYYVQFRDFYDH